MEKSYKEVEIKIQDFDENCLKFKEKCNDECDFILKTNKIYKYIEFFTNYKNDEKDLLRKRIFEDFIDPLKHENTAIFFSKLCLKVLLLMYLGFADTYAEYIIFLDLDNYYCLFYGTNNLDKEIKNIEKLIKVLGEELLIEIYDLDTTKKNIDNKKIQYHHICDDIINNEIGILIRIPYNDGDKIIINKKKSINIKI